MYKTRTGNVYFIKGRSFMQIIKLLGSLDRGNNTFFLPPKEI